MSMFIKQVTCLAKELLVWPGNSSFGSMRFFEKFHFLVFLFCLIGKLMLAAMLGFNASELIMFGSRKVQFFLLVNHPFVKLHDLLLFLFFYYSLLYNSKKAT